MTFFFKIKEKKGFFPLILRQYRKSGIIFTFSLLIIYNRDI